MGDPGGIPDDTEATLSPGTRLGKYEIVRLLGAGGMGSVYEAAHTEIGKRVAVKVLSLAVAAVPGARARFLREAQLTSRVRHPNIVDVTDMGSDAGQTYLVMEFLRGEDLAQRLARTGPLPAQELVDIMLPVCSAVVEAHDAGVTHRDLKPQNIFLAAARHAIQPKVLDFGISKGNDMVGAGSLTGTGAMIGTPFYLAPEQIIDSRSAGPQSDQYALGVIMYECLTGQRPFEAESIFMVFQAIVGGRPTSPRRSRPDLSIALEEVVLRAMNVDPKARFASAKELGRALLPFASARARSNWEEVFNAPRGESTIPPPMTPAVASYPGGTRELTPAADDPKSWDKVLGAAADRRERQYSSPPESAIATLDVPIRLGWRARKVTWIGGIAGFAGIAVIVGIAMSRRGAPDTDGKSKDTSAVVATTEQTEKVETPITSAKPASTESPAAQPSAATEQGSAKGESAKGESAKTESAETPAAPATFDIKVMADPDSATLQFDDEPAVTGPLRKTLPVDHARHTLRVASEGYVERTIEFTDKAPPRKIRLSRNPRPPSDDTSIGSPAPKPRRPRPQPDPFPSHSLNPNGAPVID